MMDDSGGKKTGQAPGGHGSRAVFIGCLGCVAAILLITLGSMVVFRENMLRNTRLLEDTGYERYEDYYVMITSDDDSAFWQSVYESARREGMEKGACVEMIGRNLSTGYSKEELLHIAIASGVDGIILEADESEATAECLREAWEREIPVVTVLEDDSQGNRRSFVGVSYYNLGREYGRQVLAIRDRKVEDILVLMSAEARDTSQNIIFSGIQETLAQEGEHGISVRAAAVENQGAFDAEESIRDIFMEEALPDVIICLDEISTSCAYQAVVDYNKVGLIDIIGYYDSETILRAIERNVVRATISIDTREMGSSCVAALDEYRKNGYVSEYFSVGTSLITTENVGAYLGARESEENP